MIRRAYPARAGFWFLVATIGLVVLSLSGLNPAEASQPTPWQIDFQPAATKHMEQIHWFHTWLVYVITAISLFVLGLLLWIMVRYNQRSNPVPAKFSHNTAIEVIWTIVPIIILVGISIPSVRILYEGDVVPKADMTIKVTGLPSWAWTYKYPDNGDIEFTSIILSDEDAKAKGEPRLLGVDNQMVVPVGKVIRMQVTSEPNGIIHSWAVPAFGVKTDAVPGKLNETWFKAERTGVFYGQCSELCGVKHAYMPIAVRVVTEAEFATWVEDAKKQFGSNDNSKTKIAAR